MTLILITIRAATIAKPLQRLPLFTTFQRERYTWKRSPGHPTLCLTPLPVHLHEGPPPYWVISLPVQFSAVPSPAAKPPCKSDLPDGSTTLLPHPPAGPRRCYGMMHRCIPANLPPPPHLSGRSCTCWATPELYCSSILFYSLLLMIFHTAGPSLPCRSSNLLVHISADFPFCQSTYLLVFIFFPPSCGLLTPVDGLSTCCSAPLARNAYPLTPRTAGPTRF